VVAALSAWHENHEAAAEAIKDIKRLPAHVIIEAYSVLTRLPGGHAVPAATAASTLADRFPDPPLRLGDDDRANVLQRLSAAAIFGGASYDGLVALEAKAHERALLSLDTRAATTYQRLGTSYSLIA
jgi:hypothetical protein